jgi:hypothetical protein
MAKLREFMESGMGKGAALVVVLLAGVAVYFSVRANFGSSSAGDLSRERTFICSETHRPFEYTLKVGDQIPVKSPHSGKNTGYPAELCYWTKDGKIKDAPTAVLLRSNLGERGPTFCPDCGRLVIGHNPRPSPGDRPPPTEAEYRPRGARERE